jgi:hypothetical protein
VVSAEQLFEITDKLVANFDATLRYWAIYQAAADSRRIDEFFATGDIETNGIVVIRNGMIRLVVLNLDRAFDRSGRNDVASLRRVLRLLSRGCARSVASDPLIAGESGIGSVDRRVAAIETCTSQIQARLDSDDAKWVRALRNDDVAHLAGC